MSSDTFDQTSSNSGAVSLHNLHRSIVTVYVSPEQYPFYLHKGRLCRQSSFFERAFHGSFGEATTGSLYLEEDGVEEFKLFEEWLYTEKLRFPQESDDQSYLLIKLFCFAEKVETPGLQNAALDAIRDRATGQHVSTESPKPTSHIHGKSQSPFAFTPGSGFSFPTYQTKTVTEKPSANYLPPATSSAIHCAYLHTPEGSPLRKLLADIFAYNVKADTLNEDLQSFPVEFTVDVLLINMKRLPLRMKEERADFDVDMSKYYIHKSSNAECDKRQRVFGDMQVQRNDSEVSPRNESSVEAGVPDDIVAVSENDARVFGVPNGASSSKGKKKGLKRSM